MLFVTKSEFPTTTNRDSVGVFSGFCSVGVGEGVGLTDAVGEIMGELRGLVSPLVISDGVGEALGLV